MNKKILIVFLSISLFLTIGCGKKNENNIDNNVDNNVSNEETKQLSIVDENSNSRPYAVVINNYPGAVKVQTGLQDAYMIYEIPVEGGMSRSLALYKDKTTSKIGTVRSARHDFLDYVLENDAIFVHFGWSSHARFQISNLGINNINGLSDSPFWRENPEGLPSEHTAYTNLTKVAETAKSKGYRLTTNTKPVLNYSVDEINLNDKENSVVANNVEIPYSGSYKVKFVYDEVNKNYVRYVNGVAHTDYFTNDQFTSKNIIIVKFDSGKAPDNYYLDLNNVGNGNGYYITNGYAVPITWEKTDNSSKTIYKYKNGDEVNVNDGNTYIMMQLLNQETKIS